jgi:hypothetical protein
MARRLAKRKPESRDKEVEAKKTRPDEDKESEKSKESEKKEDPYAIVVAPDGVSKYIVRNYKDDMKEMNILDKCVVRSQNRRFFTEPEAIVFWRKSTAACPTYGACYW